MVRLYHTYFLPSLTHNNYENGDYNEYLAYTERWPLFARVNYNVLWQIPI
jgi:hypothetical protein